MSEISWVAVDWGTSQLRAWGLSEQNNIVCTASSDQGMGNLAPEQFESALLQLIGSWLSSDRRTPVIACGMVGARQGWIEAPYIEVPCHVANELVEAPTTDPRVQVYLCPGVKQMTPADVMRGEETQIAGVIEHDPKFNGFVCLPGTHSKWVHVENGVINRFTTFMTGELFALLNKQSVLRHSVNTNEFDLDAFLHALKTTHGAPDLLAANLFSIRSNDMLHNTPAAQLRAELSGMVIGAELSAVMSHYISDEAIIILGSDKLASLYQKGLEVMGKPSELVSGETFTLSGLKRAYRLLQQRSV